MQVELCGIKGELVNFTATRFIVDSEIAERTPNLYNVKLLLNGGKVVIFKSVTKEEAEAMFESKPTNKIDIVSTKENNDGQCKIEKRLNEILNLPTCNTCRKRNCTYRPLMGEMMRYNCPFHEY